MSDIFYCKKCVFPSSKPHLTFNEEGICSACTGHELKNNVDWELRRKTFEYLINKVVDTNGENLYDAVVPVSGGKDSIYQVHKVVEFGLKVLAVTVDYGIKTEVGRKNLEIITNLGVDLLTFKPGNHHREIIRNDFIDYGDPDISSHVLLYSYPMHIAREKKIPLVIYGENPAFEYMGDEDFFDECYLSKDWFLKYVIKEEHWNTHKNYLMDYYFPPFVMHRKTRFLGYYFSWDSKYNFELAKSLGFQTVENGIGTYRNYVGIDEVINRVHQYMKLVVLGYGRATDHACEDIREGLITREEAIDRVIKYDVPEFSKEYKKIFCNYINITEKQFDSVVNKFRNVDAWDFNLGENDLPIWYLKHNFDTFKN